MEREELYYKAMLSRDARFDGKFFVGVKTTGVYCRPICPARPRRQNVEFFLNRELAERAGYRPCLRCRPESAPQSPAWIGKSAVVNRAIRKLNSAESLALNEDEFASAYGITARHLRRLFQEEIGKTPKQIAFRYRLDLTRKLLNETNLPIAEVAFAAGFKSVRRFNDAFKKRFKRAPSQIRRAPLQSDGLCISLSYRPPFDFEGLLRIYRSHQVGDLEEFGEGTMLRRIENQGQVGSFLIRNDAEKSRLLVDIDFPDLSYLGVLIARVRALFDLESDPVLIANALETDTSIGRLLKRHPGIRIPSGFDPFETGVAAILGQLVSVERGRALVADLIKICGREIHGRKYFPTPEILAKADLTALKSTGARKRTLGVFSAAIVSGRVSLDPAQAVEKFMESVLELPGIGPWTASYMALKCLRHADAFPYTDLILARALDLHPRESLDKISPWRGYAAALFWREYTHKLKRTKNVAI